MLGGVAQTVEIKERFLNFEEVQKSSNSSMLHNFWFPLKKSRCILDIYFMVVSSSQVITYTCISANALYVFESALNEEGGSHKI